MPSIHIHLLKHPTKVGDNNQLNGILMAFKQRTYFSTEVTEWNCTDQDQLNKLQAKVISAGKVLHVILSSGEQGLAALQQIKFDASQSVLTCWTAHQQYPEIKNCLDKINVMALPKYAVDATFRASLPEDIILVETMGVAHAVTSKSIENIFLEWQVSNSHEHIQSYAKYIAVVLGGDAIVRGEKKYFYPPEAALLAQYVSKLAKQYDAHVLITDSPRTGKGVTDSFLSMLIKEKIAYQYFPFVPGQPSAYQPILGALSANPENIAIVTADSSSMAAEMYHVLKCPLMIANVGSTDEVFINYTKNVGLASHVIHLTEQSYSVEEIKQTNEQVKEFAGLTIAAAIKKQLRFRICNSTDNYSGLSHFTSRKSEYPAEQIIPSGPLLRV